MRIDVHHHIHFENELRADLAKISHQIQTLKEITMASQAALAASLTALAAQLEKAKAEVTAEVATLNTKVQELTDALGNVQTTPEVDAALAAVQTSAQALDDMNPDATV